MQQQHIDLGFVLGNTLADLSWTGFTFVCALGLIGLLWCVLPFAVFGVKRRLDAIENAQRHQTELLIAELRRANEILTRRIGGSASAEGTDPWHGVPAQAAAPAAGAAAAGLRPAALAAGQRPPAEPLAPVLVQATQYEPYPDDPRPEAPTPRRELRWSRFGQSRSSGSVA